MKDFKTMLLDGSLVPQVNEVLHKEIINDLTSLRNIASPLIQQHPDVEKFYTLYLDAKNRLLLLEPSFNGSLTGCSVYPREIVKKALEVGAAAIIVFHNHPSGDLTPSKADILITKRIIMAANLLEITLHDHVICSTTNYYSMSEDGIINTLKREWKNFLWNTEETENI